MSDSVLGTVKIMEGNKDTASIKNVLSNAVISKLGCLQYARKCET